jgi:plasmid maintenance system antidote protein VapI
LLDGDPAHAGRFVKSEIVEAPELSVTDAAKALGATRPAARVTGRR